MFETPIGFRKAAHLNEPVKLTLAGKDFTFAAGDQFAGANIYGKSSSLIPRSAAIFCGNERMNAFKALTAFSHLGVTSLKSAERVVGKGCDSTRKSRWAPC